MPWRGPEEKGEFPTLGYQVAEWIEANCIIPDGPRMYQPYKLTDEMTRHLLFAHRLRPDARPGDDTDANVYSGTQLVRPQKWGKDPFSATRCLANAFAPIIFDGWDAHGEPVGRPHPSPWIAIAAVADVQTDNTYRPIVTMLEHGPLADTPGLDVGDTRTKLPGVGWIDPLTSNAKSRLGGRFTFVSITESGLLTGTTPTGGVTFARAIKRNVGGMGGQWFEITNPWDPTEMSAAQLTYEAKAEDVWIDYRQPRVEVDIDDSAAVEREVIYLYGDSARANGGWVSERRIRQDVQNKAMGEAEVRRFYLQEIIGGASSLVVPAQWQALTRPLPGELDVDPLKPKEPITLGFDGSRSKDATALIACRIRDGRLFRQNIWVPADHGGIVPRADVHKTVVDAFEAYDVRFMFADPFKWQEYCLIWSGLFPDQVVEFPTNIETRMDTALRLWQEAYRHGDLTHDGDEVFTQHVQAAAVVKGKRKPNREDENGIPEYYLRLGKKRKDQLIDAAVAAVLAYYARGVAIEHGALNEKTAAPAAANTAPVDQGQAANFFRPSGRLQL
ncbi:hypothetical protein [Lentzea sp. NBRC 102530]|uniref:hypothetical protein n=1 Tax=Lentzea sp. NBRC 102530 TaxID=3032201 RepID=UPI0024A2716A|nr:hypothetical protein [Lentzea sp. NBRC 102530]GLY55210.1 hypothetical protein Lesp01_88650 [Lentzea sp. NBRC 102530]